MARSNANGGSPRRKQRPTPLQLHQQQHRRLADPLRVSLPPAPPRRSGQRGAYMDWDRPSHDLVRRSPELNSQSERRRDDGRSREQNNQHDSVRDRGRNGFLQQQLLPPLPPPPVHELTGYERERRRGDERSLSVGPRELKSLRDNTSIRPLGQATPLNRAHIHEENRAVELTRLNAVVVQRNNTIAEAQYQNEQLKEEISRLKMAAARRLDNPPSSELRKALLQKNMEFEKMREALGSRTEMAVALHDICNRQHEFLRAIGGSIYAADAAQQRQFDAWVKSNELYMAHVKSQIAFETDWEDMVRRANAEALKEIGRAAQQAAQHMAGQIGQHAAQRSGPQHAQYNIKHAVEQLIQEATEKLDDKPKNSTPAG
ncbi:viral a-type inclusion protein [Diplodia corticola]|uniref:Viral a-type inclusion protein n=1 Tax=Diplodia corticola TaxID=236234 RepID=A0A1J9RA40_9PEZI|nr:viral a-type inclusion protein [Diplodia corticola]OJD37408.1 viral a-type inclusion protein [Diplodia corticola]